MPDLLNAFIRSIIEAVTEFLPVSSTGHLFLFSHFFPFQGLGEKTKEMEDLFDIFIQSGAILSVVVVYRKILMNETKMAFHFLTGKSKDRTGVSFFLMLGLGSLPIMVLGFILKGLLDGIKENQNLLLIMGIAWTAGGVAIFIIEKFKAGIPEAEVKINARPEIPNVSTSLIIGLSQCIALIPGVSRSLATILTGRILGYGKVRSAEYSFFLAIPVLLAAGVYKLYKYRALLNGEFIILLTAGAIISFLLCILVIRMFLHLIKKYSFSIFGYYRITLGLTIIFYYFMK